MRALSNNMEKISFPNLEFVEIPYTYDIEMIKVFAQFFKKNEKIRHLKINGGSGTNIPTVLYLLLAHLPSLIDLTIEQTSVCLESKTIIPIVEEIQTLKRINFIRCFISLEHANNLRTKFENDWNIVQSQTVGYPDYYDLTFQKKIQSN